MAVDGSPPDVIDLREVGREHADRDSDVELDPGLVEAATRGLAWLDANRASHNGAPGPDPSASRLGVHDTSRRHDTARVHDTGRVHDLSLVHNLSLVHDLSVVQDPAVAPRPTDEGVDPDETGDLAGSTGAPAQLTASELDAWDDLQVSLSRAAADLRRATGRLPAAEPRPVPPRPARPRPAAAPRPTAAPRPAAPRPAAPRPSALPPVPIHDVTPRAAAPVPTDALRPDPRRAAGRRRVGLVSLGLLLLAAALVVALTTGYGDSPSPSPAADPPQAAAPARLTPSAVTWLRASTRPGTSVAVPAWLRDQMTAALPGLDVKSYSVAGVVDLVVTPTADPGAAAGLAPSVPVATLGNGLELRQLLAPGTDWTAEQDARRAAGRELLQNDALSFTRASRLALRQGAVDSRLMTMLAGLALEHRVRVDLPGPLGQVAGPSVRLAADVLRVDGRRLVDYPWGAATVKAFLSVQSTTFMPADVTVARTGAVPGALSIRYLLPSPTGVLAGAGFPNAQ